MIYKQDSGIQWIEYELLNKIPGLQHGTFLRHGGVSTRPFDSLNLAYEIGDNEQAVRKNMDKVKQVIGCKEIHWARQVHKSGIHHLTEESPTIIDACDAFICNTPGLACMIKHADCQAALFYDPIHKAYANVHAGWRGSVVNIYAQTVQAMQNHFGTEPKNLLVCISPSLGPEQAEFIHYQKELPKAFWTFQVKENHFDFWKISQQQLLDIGILDKHIEIARICTQTNDRDCYSYRRKKVNGRHGTCIYLKHLL